MSLALASCQPAALSANPALWKVVGPRGETAWLFGTIHEAPAPLGWRTDRVGRALTQSDRIMVEVANLADESAVAAAFSNLSRTPGLPPISKRISPRVRAAFSKLLAKRGMTEGDLRDVETWAVALTLARQGIASESRYGVDRAVIAAAKGKPVVELEGAARQLAIFDTLPETEQRDLLDAVIADVGALDSQGADLVETWRKGDMARIEVETRTGLLADPELRKALFTDRNRRWAARIADALRRGHQPFVAVGAAHMAGSDGLVAMLAQAGYRVDRVE